MNLANQITLYRLLAAPLFMIFFNLGETWTKVTALVILLLALITDLLDGYVARNWQQSTLVGKILDPLVDFLFFITVFLCLMVDGWLPFWIVYVLLVRELAMHLLIRPLMLARGISPKARLAGKLKTSLQSLTAVLLVVLSVVAKTGPIPESYLRVAFWAMLIVMLLSVGSLIPYASALSRTNKTNRNAAGVSGMVGKQETTLG